MRHTTLAFCAVLLLATAPAVAAEGALAKRFERALVLAEAGKAGKADQATERLAALSREHPELAAPHRQLAVAAGEAGDFETAAHELEAALALEADQAAVAAELAALQAEIASRAPGEAPH